MGVCGGQRDDFGACGLHYQHRLYLTACRANAVDDLFKPSMFITEFNQTDGSASAVLDSAPAWNSSKAMSADR